MAEVALRNIVKMFEKTPAVRGIDLDIVDKEFIVLVGPSGCGKSTTLRMIAGLEEATSGEIFIGGDLVNDVPPKDRDIAMVFQNYALYPHMTVFENMSLGRPAPARRHGPRDRAQPEGLPLRRAPLEPRREAPRADAHRDQEGAPEGHDDDGLRHARPGRGDDARRPRRRHEPGTHRPDGDAARTLPRAADEVR